MGFSSVSLGKTTLIESNEDEVYLVVHAFLDTNKNDIKDENEQIATDTYIRVHHFIDTWIEFGSGYTNDEGYIKFSVPRVEWIGIHAEKDRDSERQRYKYWEGDYNFVINGDIEITIGLEWLERKSLSKNILSLFKTNLCLRLLSLIR